MKDKNLKVNISFKNNERDFILFQYLETKREKSNYIKDLIEKEMLKQTLNNTISGCNPTSQFSNT